MLDLITTFIESDFFKLISPVLLSLVSIMILMMSVAYLTLLERKVLGLIQSRKGPNVHGPLGVLQPLFDGVKLILKEMIIPTNANKILFVLAPVITFVIAITVWAVIPVNQGWVFADINLGVLFILAVSSLGVYGVIIAGWASKSQYALLGAMRSVSQMISYEIVLGSLVACVVLLTGSLNLTEIVNAQVGHWNAIKVPPLAVIFFITVLAETNRHPFDLPESEAELVAGYHVEYSGFLFALFFLGEYANMIMMCSFTTILFLGGWLPPLNIYPLNIVPGVVWFFLKVIVLLFFMLQIRGVTPRYRYDQLMKLCWKVYMPCVIISLVVIAFIVRYL